MYKNFNDLYVAYGLCKGDKEREDLTDEEKHRFVNDCFDTYESIEFAYTFDTPYTDKEKYIGMRFLVLGRVKTITEDPSNGADLECLPMWNIQFENGETIVAYLEEICLAER